MKNKVTILATVIIIAIMAMSNSAFAANGFAIQDNHDQNPEKVDVKVTMCEEYSTLSLSTDEDLKDATIKVLDYKGKEIKSEVEYAGDKKNVITLNEFDTGLYFIDIKALNVNITLPVIIK